MANKKQLGILGLGAVALIGGTFAYFTQTSTIDNPFDTAKYGTVVYEDFKPSDGTDWQPGAEINKDLCVTNTGDRAVVVRVKFQDIWTRDGSGDKFPELDSIDSMSVYQKDLYDGLTTGDKSVVHKYFAEGTVNGTWSTLQEDGYYYYLAKLEAGKDTKTFLDSVRLDKDVDLGKMMTQYYYTTSETRPEISTEMSGWTPLGALQPATAAQITVPEDARYTAGVTSPAGDCLGYSDAEYTLRITVETVQATAEAVKTVFASAPDEIVDGWALQAENLQ